MTRKRKLSFNTVVGVLLLVLSSVSVMGLISYSLTIPEPLTEPVTRIEGREVHLSNVTFYGNGFCQDISGLRKDGIPVTLNSLIGITDEDAINIKCPVDQDLRWKRYIQCEGAKICDCWRRATVASHICRTAKPETNATQILPYVGPTSSKPPGPTAPKSITPCVLYHSP